MNKLIALMAFVMVSTASAQPGNSGDSEGLAGRVAQLEAQVELLLSLVHENPDPDGILESFSKSGSSIFLDDADLHISGGNLHVVNGLEDTATVNGLGNIIIGYNEERDSDHPTPVNDRSGSHMLVVGARQNYASHGGIIVGASNATTGPFASVIGGYYNEALASYSAILGGVENLSYDRPASAMVGGQKNEVSGFASTITGGMRNISAGAKSSVSGGYQNEATGNNSSISGGFNGLTAADFSSISGGIGNTTSARFASVSGGSGNEASGNSSSISGGEFNTANGPASSIIGGQNQTTTSALEIKP